MLSSQYPGETGEKKAGQACKLNTPSGFDSEAHLAYIKYIQERHALPLPTEGFEMFQPPLFYVLSAIALSLFGLSVDSHSAILVLRFLTLTFGVLQFVLVFLSLRLFFPNRLSSQLVGLALAAFLPMQLYLSHYVTNETLAATLVTASVYLGLRLLRTKNPTVAQFAWLGLCLGAAMLAKATALLLVGPLFLALMIKQFRVILDCPLGDAARIRRLEMGSGAQP